MKTLRLSTLVLLLASVFFSCTKDTLSSQDSLAAANKLGLLNENGNGNGNGGGGGNTDIQPALTIVFMDGQTPVTTGVKDEEITVIGKFNMPVADQPTCGKLQLQKRRYDGTWETVIQVEVTPTVKEVQYSFTPDIEDPNATTAAFEFQLHYVKQGCAEFATNMSALFPFHVIGSCNGLDITGVVGTPVHAGGGLYEFTVTYTVTTCGLEFTKLKVQGGLTNGVSGVTTEGGLSVAGIRVPGSSTNQITTWKEEAEPGELLPDAVRTYTIKFKKAYSGTGPIELTGGWSVSVTPVEGDEIKDVFDPITYPQQ